MFRQKVAALVLIFSIFFVSQSFAEQGKISVNKISEATKVLQEIIAIPEQAIPPSLLSRAHAVVVVPNLLKAGFIVGGRYGTGVMSVRDKDGVWHYPVIVTLTGGSIGWQIGAQSTDIILVFKNLKSVDALSKGQFTLGGNASVAAGPVGRHAEAGTDAKLESEIYSYSRSRGLFAGIALEGAALQIDHDSTWSIYSSSAYDLLNRMDLKKIPVEAQDFHKTIVDYTQ
ncbi:MAG: lipid-binding SYLF domain-containing protein [Desulfobulbaceae bacterium]|nr:lipid-binding SYLF domain-containing protein [Desulfobulbaceae bacterium]